MYRRVFLELLAQEVLVLDSNRNIVSRCLSTRYTVRISYNGWSISSKIVTKFLLDVRIMPVVHTALSIYPATKVQSPHNIVTQLDTKIHWH